MHTIHRALGVGLLALALPLGVSAQAGKQAAAPKKLYCWNENGRKVCGDALPAHAVDAERTELSASSGREVARLERALTEEERKAEAERLAAERRAALEAEAARRRLLAMVESYATEDDLRRAFQERVTLLEETTKAARLGIENLRQSLISLLRRAAEAELAGRPVNKALADSIQRQHADLRRQQAVLAKQLDERARIDAEIAEALQRYREIKLQRAQAAGQQAGQSG